MKFNQDTQKNIKILILALLFSFGMGVAHSAWEAPTKNPVLCDEVTNEGCSTPINVGPGEDNEPQIKEGSLILGSAIPAGGLSLFVEGGRVAVGVGASATESLDVLGYIKGKAGLCISGDPVQPCRTSWPSWGSVSPLQLPVGSVVAFDLSNCPTSGPGTWAEFVQAKGKMIVGSNSAGTDLLQQPFGIGAEEINQAASQVASHNHSFGAPQYVTNFGQSGSSNCCNQGSNMITVGQFAGVTTPTNAGGGSGQDMNIMNPYQTLKYCVKTS